MNTRQWHDGRCPGSFPNIPLYKNKPRLRRGFPCVPSIARFVGLCSGCPVGRILLFDNIPRLSTSCRSTCGIEPNACSSKHCQARGCRHVRNDGWPLHSVSVFGGCILPFDILPLFQYVSLSTSDKVNKIHPNIPFARDNRPILW